MKRISVKSKKFPDAVALVDDEDFEKVSEFRWYAYRGKREYSLYALGRRRGTKDIPIRMHSLIMNSPPGAVVDHIDMDGLNNQKENLRIVSRQKNKFNSRKPKNGVTSKYKGVYWAEDRGAYRACIRVNRKLINLGQFDSEEDAARARDVAAELYHGEFSVLNFKKTRGG